MQCVNSTELCRIYLSKTSPARTITRKNLSKYVAGGRFESLITRVGRPTVIRSSFVLPGVASRCRKSSGKRIPPRMRDLSASSTQRSSLAYNVVRTSSSAYGRNFYPYARCQLVVTVIHGGFTAACAPSDYPSLLACAFRNARPWWAKWLRERGARVSRERERDRDRARRGNLRTS